MPVEQLISPENETNTIPETASCPYPVSIQGGLPGPPEAAHVGEGGAADLDPDGLLAVVSVELLVAAEGHGVQLLHAVLVLDPLGGRGRGRREERGRRDSGR